MVRELSARWELRLGAPFGGGCVAYVAPAERADGSRAVLKISFVDDETRHEAEALAIWAGRGAVLLLDRDEALGAMLLERLEPGTALRDYPDRGAVIGIACRLLRRLRTPLEPGHPFALVASLASDWTDDLPEQFEQAGRPFPASYIDLAAGLCRELAVPGEPVMLVNRDFHLGNVLAAAREPWLAIDPKPLAGEPAFDTGHFLRSSLSSDFTPDEVERLLTRLSTELELPPRRIAKWALVRSVENAIWGAETGLEDSKRDIRCAQVLERWI